MKNQNVLRILALVFAIAMMLTVASCDMLNKLLGRTPEATTPVETTTEEPTVITTTEAPSTTKKPVVTTTKTPETGDTSAVFAAIATLTVASAAAFVCLKKKEN